MDSELLAALVETKRVVASGMGTAERTLSRKKSALVRGKDEENQEELARIRRRRTRQRDNFPFYDRVSARTGYQALVHLLSASHVPTDRPYVLLAQQKIEEITDRQGSDQESQLAFIERHLERADELVAAGDGRAARRIWESVVALYDGNRELAALVDRARDQIPAQDRAVP